MITTPTPPSVRKLDILETLLCRELNDLFAAECLILEVLPEMAGAAHHPELRMAFEDHLRETKTHVERLRSLVDGTLLSADSQRCPALGGLIEEIGQLIDVDATPEIRDAALIAVARKIAHFEIATYGTTAFFASQLGMQYAEARLRDARKVEEKTDRALADLAERVINDNPRIA